jgi:hypothetical protein
LTTTKTKSPLLSFRKNPQKGASPEPIEPEKAGTLTVAGNPVPMGRKVQVTFNLVTLVVLNVSVVGLSIAAAKTTDHVVLL